MKDEARGYVVDCVEKLLQFQLQQPIEDQFQGAVSTPLLSDLCHQFLKSVDCYGQHERLSVTLLTLLLANSYELGTVPNYLEL